MRIVAALCRDGIISEARSPEPVVSGLRQFSRVLSSAGRAPPRHAGGRWIVPSRTHHSCPVAQRQSTRPITARPRLDTVRDNQTPRGDDDADHAQTGAARRRDAFGFVAQPAERRPLSREMSVRLRPNPPIAPLAQWQSADLLSPEIALQVRGGVRACTPTWQRDCPEKAFNRRPNRRRHTTVRFCTVSSPIGAQSPHQAADSRMWNLLLVASAQRKSIFALGSVCPPRAV